VNLGQASNDVTPTAVRLMALELAAVLLAELERAGEPELNVMPLVADSYGRPLRDVVTDRELVDHATLHQWLDPVAITRPQRVDVALRRRRATPAYRRLRAALR
jgi:hypothetical protein